MSKTGHGSTIEASSSVAVRHATDADLNDVVRLARAVQLFPSVDTRTGFLVSALSRDVYAAALRYPERKENAEHVTLLVAESNGDAVGFLFGYNDIFASRRSGGQSEADIVARFSEPFYVLKQIATASEQRRKGVARALVQKFFAEAQCNSIFSAIVTNPENPASCAFHRKMGFSPIFDSVSRNTNGETYPNQVWRRACHSALSQ